MTSQRKFIKALLSTVYLQLRLFDDLPGKRRSGFGVSVSARLHPFLFPTNIGYPFGGRLAQLGEHGVRNAEVEGSNPLPSTNST